jgi:hypothetical protein
VQSVRLEPVRKEGHTLAFGSLGPPYKRLIAGSAVVVDSASLMFNHATILVILRRQPKDRRTKSFRRQAVCIREPFHHLPLVTARGKKSLS